MNVREESFLDHSEPTDDGIYDYWYEGWHYLFEFEDGRAVGARRYSDTPSEAIVFFNATGPDEGDPEIKQVVDWLRMVGVSDVLVMGGPSGTTRSVRLPD